MSRDERLPREGFLERWSRLKSEAVHAEPEPRQPIEHPQAASPPPELPPVDKLTLESDFSGFFHPKVDESLRRAALRKLFNEPHFNVMDGLDVYIDDYSKPDPIPAAMLAALRQARVILDPDAHSAGDRERAGGAPRDVEDGHETARAIVPSGAAPAATDPGVGAAPITQDAPPVHPEVAGLRTPEPDASDPGST
jgi:hypothetical protein